MGKEKEMEFTNKMVADLFLGQEVIDRKKEEIKRFFKMASGLLGTVGEHLVRPIGVTGFTGYHIEVRQKLTGELIAWAVPDRLLPDPRGAKEGLPAEAVMALAGSPVLGVWGIKIPLQDVFRLHDALPEVLAALVKEFPTLEQKLRVFLEQAKEA